MKKQLTFSAHGNKDRTYRQREFILSTFNISGNSRGEMSREMVALAIRKLKDLGLNQIELGHAAHDVADMALEECEKQGINVLWQDNTLFGGFQNQLRKMTTEDEIKKLVEDTKKLHMLSGFYVWDEPWEKQDLDATRRQTDWLDKYAPGKLGFSAMVPNYNPAYTWENMQYPWYVGHFLDEVNPSVVSFDYYPIGEGKVKEYTEAQIDNSFLWKDMAVVRNEAVRRDWPLWFYFQAIRLGKFPDKYHFAMTRMQTSYALMYGAKCLQCYGIAGSKVCPDGLMEKRRVLENDYQEGCFYDDMKTLLFSLKNLGKTFIALRSEHVYHGDEVLPEDTYYNENLKEDFTQNKIFHLEKLPFRCSVGILSDEHFNTYIVIVNRDYEIPRTFTLPLFQIQRVYEVSKADGKHYVRDNCTDCINVTLDPGDLVLYRIQDAGEEVYDIEYVCQSEVFG